jgi:hypothetical protein
MKKKKIKSYELIVMSIGVAAIGYIIGSLIAIMYLHLTKC